MVVTVVHTVTCLLSLASHYFLRMTYSFLLELGLQRDDWLIRVRICRMWESFNPKKNGELIGLDMIFIDEKENLMHATINKKLYNKFKDKLTEGSLSVIKKFKVVENSGRYRPVESNFKINFLLKTVVKSLKEDVSIPINGFQFITPDMIDSRVNNNTVLSDVVGYLCGVGDMEIVGSRWKKRDIQIVTNQ
uniref:Uncharacterized protein LOC104224088 isoform X1 n=1 Tax=Nicotiana sylvestris TaxID=4096 RepID=A0A1U7W9R8_NICSY|nr:PREDICTED: uncharacterized protein LOC104224088 isoform X1 [Nicotiana sylvestris]